MEVFVTTMAPRKGERKGHHQNKEEFRIKKLYINQMVYLYTIELISNLTRHLTLVDLVSVMESI